MSMRNVGGIGRLADGQRCEVHIFHGGFGRLVDGLGPAVRTFLCGTLAVWTPSRRLADGLGPGVRIFGCGICADLVPRGGRCCCAHVCPCGFGCLADGRLDDGPRPGGVHQPRRGGTASTERGA